LFLFFALVIGAVSGAMGNVLFNFVGDVGKAVIDKAVYLHDVHSKK